MSELEARKYTSIRNLREEIRQDMEEINLLRQTAHIDAGNFNFYNDYLLNRINTNIQLVKKRQVVDKFSFTILINKEKENDYMEQL